MTAQKAASPQIDAEQSPKQSHESAAAEFEQTSTPLTPEEAADLIRSIQVPALFQLLKHRDYIVERERVFAGVRVNADNLRAPLVRSRLIAELTKNTKLADGVRNLPKTAPHPKPPPVPEPSISYALPKPERDTHLAAERDRLKRELREAREALKDADRQKALQARELADAQSELAKARAQLTSDQNQSAWRERRMHRLERELADARNAANARRRDAPSAKPADVTQHSSEPVAAQPTALERPAFADALERLLSRGKTDAVALIVDEVLHRETGDTAARRVRALVRIAHGDRPGALKDLRFIFEAHLGAGDPVQAAYILVRSVIVEGAPDKKMAQALFAAVSRRSETIDSVAEALRSLSGMPHMDMLRSWCKPALAARLFADPGQGSAAALPVKMLQALGVASLTPQRLMQAIDRNEEKLIAAARSALKHLDRLSREQVAASLSEAQTDDSYFRLLSRRELSGPAIVDASNVAHFELEMMAARRPLLANVLAVRRALRERGYFPVVMIADANLPYVVDSADRLRQLVAQGEVDLVTSGVVADEVIVREARRLNAVVITNDYMADWDPEGTVEKVQYSISLTDGKATLYF